MKILGVFHPLKRPIRFEHVYYCRIHLTALSTEKYTETHPSSLGARSVLPLECRKEMAEKNNKYWRIIINSTHDKLRDQWKTAMDSNQIWAQHIINREELERYAAAIIHREERYMKKEQPEHRPSSIEWCYNQLQWYFRGGEKEIRRDLEHKDVAQHLPHLLPPYCISNSVAASAATGSRETLAAVNEGLTTRSDRTLMRKVSVADDQSAQSMQDGEKRMETKISTEVDSGSSDRILSDEALATNVNNIFDSEMISISKDVSKVDSLPNKSHQDNFIVKEFTRNGDSFTAKESVATTSFAVSSSKVHELNSVLSSELSFRTSDTKKLSDAMAENSVPAPTLSPFGTDAGTFQTSDRNMAGNGPRLRVLDVGSCFNPFKVYSDLDVVALDLLPATKDTFQCDFLKLTIAEPNKAIFEAASFLPGVESLDVDIPDEGAGSASKSSPSSRTITSLEANSFDAVIFSSFLSYLPCPEQRLFCCKQAYRLIKPEGVLVLSELDPRGGKRCGYLIESWYIALSSLGFSRVQYQKRKKFHGMLFRKGLFPEVHQLRTKCVVEKMNQRKNNIVFQKNESNALFRQNQLIKDFDLDKALTGLWLWHNLSDVRQEEVTRMPLKRSSRLPKPKVDSQTKLKFTWIFRSYMNKITKWIRNIMVTKNDS